MRSSIPFEWVNNLTSQEEVSEFEAEFYQARKVLKRLIEILDKKQNAIQTNMIKRSNYTERSWSEKQADYIGSLKMIDEIKSLLKTLDK